MSSGKRKPFAEESPNTKERNGWDQAPENTIHNNQSADKEQTNMASYLISNLTLDRQ